MAEKVLPQEVYEEVFEPPIGEGPQHGGRFRTETDPFEQKVIDAVRELTSGTGIRFDGFKEFRTGEVLS